MNRREPIDGIYLSKLPAEKFRKCRISVNFVMPSERSTATAYALLPYLLERSYEDCPDMTALSVKLSSLYGVDLSVDSSVSGANRFVTVAVTGIKEEYALNGENLTSEYTKLLLGVAFRPYLVEGLFPADIIEIEKDKLMGILESECNNKRTYCVRQAARNFYKDSPNGIEANGYLEEVDGVTAEMLTSAYQKMVQDAHVEVMVLGADENAVETELKAFFKDKKRTPQPFLQPFSEPITDFSAHEEPIEATQGKICLMFNIGKILSPEESLKMRFAVSVFGGLPTSRLFVNVREKQSLCYYCTASYSAQTGLVVSDSGVEFDKAEHTLTAIREELAKLVEKEVDETELADTKRQLINHYNTAADSLFAIENFYISGVLRGSDITIEKAVKIIEETTATEVKEFLSLLTPALSYTLCEQKGGDVE